MAKETLIIADIIKLPDGSLSLVVNTEKPSLRDEWRQRSMADLKESFRDKTVVIIGDDYRLVTEILDVEAMSSIAEFKNVFLKIESSEQANKIKQLDQLEVEL